MEAGDKLVLDSLNLFKAATEKSIKALQDAERAERLEESGE